MEVRAEALVMKLSTGMILQKSKEDQLVWNTDGNMSLKDPPTIAWPSK
jgi:hypothetical protein